ncbi:MAG TPA: hypothetical protein VNJ08_05435 [Bacteriovoracaceae bacterium]|nr:hypothetical protein [Bacteriovoracaceae bacterium]
MSKQEEKSGVQKMRERHERIKKSIKPSKELVEIFSKKEKPKTKNENAKNKVARPFTPEAGA